MTPIPDTYSKNGYDFELVTRVGRVALYAQKRSGVLVAYEVCLIRSRDARMCFGKPVEAMEYLPSNEDWGVYGKTYSLSGRSDMAARRAAEDQVEAWSVPATSALVAGTV